MHPYPNYVASSCKLLYFSYSNVLLEFVIFQYPNFKYRVGMCIIVIFYLIQCARYMGSGYVSGNCIFS